MEGSGKMMSAVIHSTLKKKKKKKSSDLIRITAETRLQTTLYVLPRFVQGTFFAGVHLQIHYNKFLFKY